VLASVPEKSKACRRLIFRQIVTRKSSYLGARRLIFLPKARLDLRFVFSPTCENLGCMILALAYLTKAYDCLFQRSLSVIL